MMIGIIRSSGPVIDAAADVNCLTPRQLGEILVNGVDIHQPARIREADWQFPTAQ